MPITTFDNRDVDKFSSILDLDVTTSIGTTTGKNDITRTRTFTVSGDGLLYVSGSVYTDATSDTGSVEATLYQNGVTVAVNGNRFTSASSMNAMGQVSGLLKVNDGDSITIKIYTSKNGAKTFYWYHLGISCTAVQSGG